MLRPGLVFQSPILSLPPELMLRLLSDSGPTTNRRSSAGRKKRDGQFSD